MCGIAGILSMEDNKKTLSFINEMTDIIRHRGPDDSGAMYFSNSGRFSHDVKALTAHEAEQGGGVVGALGHRRLSIIDLSSLGHQPMSYAGQRYWISYNGEIYNHVELRKELEGKGHSFISRTDTEVILAAYAEWGRECLHRFNGMWAFILVDLGKKILFASRDRFGIKPLYYWRSADGVLAFASEIKQFTVLPGWQAKINGQRAYDFLNWGLTDHTNETLFAGVFQMRGGEALEMELTDINGTIPVYRWYNLRHQQFSGSMEEAARTFRDLLTSSVELRLRADVPVGSCLSGGLDSSSIVCLVNDLLHKQGSAGLQKTFSACSDIKRFDEREYIEEVIKQRAIEDYYVYPSYANLFDEFKDVTWHQDEPFGSTSIYAQWHVFSLAASNGVKVMLDGQGADELLAGYHSFFAPRLAGLFKHVRLACLCDEARALNELHGYSYTHLIKIIANVLLPEPVRQKAREFSGKMHANPAWMSLDKLGAEPIDPFTECGTKTSTIGDLSYVQILSTNLPMLLHWEDRNSMAHSIESRVPFLDYRLVEFVLGLPDDYKLSGGWTKRVLRQGMAGILPDKIKNRTDKLGFVTPEEVWVKENVPDKFRAGMSRTIEVSEGIIKPEAILKLEKVISGREAFSFWAWRVVNFGAWMEKFGVSAD